MNCFDQIMKSFIIRAAAWETEKSFFDLAKTISKAFVLEFAEKMKVFLWQDKTDPVKPFIILSLIFSMN